MPVRRVASSDRRCGYTRQKPQAADRTPNLPAIKAGELTEPPRPQKLGPGTLVLDVKVEWSVDTDFEFAAVLVFALWAPHDPANEEKESMVNKDFFIFNTSITPRIFIQAVGKEHVYSFVN